MTLSTPANLNAIATPNLRVKKIQRALDKRPVRGVRVALMCKSQPARIGEWTVTEVHHETASEIEMLMAEHAEELGFLVVEFQLVWEAEDGRPILSPGITWRRPSDDSDPLDRAPLDGGDRTERLQDQRHKEVNMRMWSQNHMQQVRMYAEQLQQTHDRLMEAYVLVDELRQELAVAQITLAKQGAKEAEPSAEITPLQEKALAMLSQYLPMFLAAQAQRNAGGGTPSNGES